MPKKSDGDRWLIAFSYAPAFVADWNMQKRSEDDIYTATHYEAASEVKFLKEYLKEQSNIDSKS
jgi:hypothetical protein